MHLEQRIHSIYSQLYIADGLTTKYLNEELTKHEMQGFCARRNSVAVQTTVDELYHVCISHDVLREPALLTAVFAIRIPCSFDSGFVFVEGMMMPAPVSIVEGFCEIAPSEVELQHLADTTSSLVCPAKGVTSLVFVEQPSCLVRIYLERRLSPKLELLVPNDQYPLQADFLNNAEPFSP